MGCHNSKERARPIVQFEPPVRTERPKSFADKYEQDFMLGEGAFGQVFKCKNRETGMYYAVKVVDLSPLDEKEIISLNREVEIMWEMNHEHIVKLIEVIKERSTYYIVMELMLGGHLLDRIIDKGTFSEREARDAMKILLETIKYCHDHDIVHRDLKPENLLLVSTEDDANLKICDFGFANHDLTNTLKSQVGTPHYLAPELLNGSSKYGRAVDMWSIGVIMFELLGGCPPFDEQDIRVLYAKISRAMFEFDPQYWSMVSEEAKDMIRGLLEVDPAKRLTADQALSHPWVTTDCQSPDQSLRLQHRKVKGKEKFKLIVKGIIVAQKLASNTSLEHHPDNLSPREPIQPEEIVVESEESLMV